MNAYQKSVELGLTGTDAEIVEKLRCLTRGPIPVANVLQWFDDQNLAELDPIDNAWVGTLVSVVKNPATPSLVAAGLRKLFVHLAKRTSQTVDTTNITVAVETSALMDALQQMGVVTPEQRLSFLLLDGGPAYGDLTVEQFSAQRAEDDAKQAAELVDQSYAAAVNTHLNEALSNPARTIESIAAALLATANAMEANR